MIYLLQDCYKDTNGEYHDILKIGYSNRSFMEGRKSQYDTHNFGYKLLSEREGSQELERYLHRRLQEYNLSLEWFKYDQEVINIFNEVSENDISQFKSQEELNKFIRGYILDNLIPSVNKLLSLYLKKILDELKEKDIDYEKNENLYRKEILGVFKFVSSKEREYFENLNFTSQENIKILEDHNLIISKSKKKDNFLLESIVLFYKTKRKKKELSKESFDELQNKRRESTKNLLDLYNSANSDQKSDYLQKLKDSIKVSKYERDFVSISSKTNSPVYNKFIELADKRAWKVSQKDYQDQISVTKAISDLDYDLLNGIPEEFGLAIQSFIKEFDGTTLFAEKLRIYCEYLDFYLDNKYVTENIKFYVKDPDFQKFYEFYGTTGCKARKYLRSDLERGVVDNSEDKQSKLILELDIYFKPSLKYTLKDIKNSLKTIYDKLGVSNSPKAVDLKNYYNISEIKLYDSITKKQSKGYLIISKKVI